jgi:hypothetical protein
MSVTEVVCGMDDMRISTPQENIEKFKQVFLYITKKVGAWPNVGKTVLVKLLYFIDFDYYEQYEEQLMGLKYIKKEFGPLALNFNKMINGMKKAAQIKEVASPYSEYQRKYLPLVEPDISLFTEQEIKHIDSVLEKHAHKNDKEISDFSHKDIPWLAADMDKELKYEAVFYRNEDTAVTVND